MDAMDDIIKEFIVESHENLDRLDRDLVSLEKDPTSRDLLASVFRAIHTLKGTTGFLGFSRLESVAHVGESLLSRLRDGELVLSPPVTSGLLAMVDAVRTMLDSIEATGSDGDTDYSALIEMLARLQDPEAAREMSSCCLVQESSAGAADHAERNRREVQAPQPEAGANSRETDPIGDIVVSPEQFTDNPRTDVSDRYVDGDPQDQEGTSATPQGGRPREMPDRLQPQNEAISSHLSNNNIRVDVGQLDKLMNLVGELVLARNQILQFGRTQQDAGFVNTTQRLSLITTELQEGFMKTRMQPIENIWGRFPRVVRDLAVACGKQVEVEMEGRDTELDKTILEAIKDPLTHLVRNAVDHGIELPSLRVAAGKPPVGRLFLRAYHEGGQVNIEISDDGTGIDLNAVKRKAIERGLVTQEQAARTGEREAYQMIFLPGFSTAEKVTNVSGRGVGMDVVKTNVEKIGGVVDLQSTPGSGTAVKIKIPLTLAIIPALIVTSGGERFAIPQASLVELVRLEDDGARQGIESVHGASVYRLRGKLLSLIYLNHELQFSAADPRTDTHQDVVNIAVLQADECQFGLIVDEVDDTEEIVVKPLGKLLNGLPVYTGATIMGDGSVALILDVLGLAQHAGVIGDAREQKLAGDLSAREIEAQEQRKLLLFQNPDGGSMAIPLSDVTRLETFSLSSIERTGKQQVVQYRGTILPLVHISDLAQESSRQSLALSSQGDDKIQVIVHTQSHRSVGMVVDRIMDIVESDLSARRPPNRRGVLGSIVVQDKVAEILDVDEVIRVHDPTFFAEEPSLRGVA